MGSKLHVGLLEVGQSGENVELRRMMTLFEKAQAGESSGLRGLKTFFEKVYAGGKGRRVWMHEG